MTVYKERGNVLFLILIAVALFAALSYAVTQSSRGGGNADSETQAISMAGLVNYVSGIRFGVQRLAISGVDPVTLNFQSPQSITCLADTSLCLHHSDGGGAVYYNTNNLINNFGFGPDIADATDVWHNIEGVGTSAGDIVFYIEDVTQAKCEEFNKYVNVSGIPNDDTADGEINGLNGLGEFCFFDDNEGFYYIAILVYSL